MHLKCRSAFKDNKTFPKLKSSWVSQSFILKSKNFEIFQVANVKIKHLGNLSNLVTLNTDSYPERIKRWASAKSASKKKKFKRIIFYDIFVHPNKSIHFTDIFYSMFSIAINVLKYFEFVWNVEMQNLMSFARCLIKIFLYVKEDDFSGNFGQHSCFLQSVCENF